MRRFSIGGGVFLCAVLLAPRVEAQSIKRDRTVNFAQLATPPAAEAVGHETRRGPDANEDLKSFIRGSISAARVSSAHVPRPNDRPVTGPGAGFFGFNGLSHADQRLADGGNQFSIEPPDQAIAVGNGFVLEAVNLALRVRTTGGDVAASTVSLNRFFASESAIVRPTATTPGRSGRFMSDPKAYFDVANQRWFVTVLTIATDPATGNFRPQSDVRIAVSRTADPTGNWSIFVLETTNGTGTTPNHPGCPCFGDQPLLGADAHGVYITTNEFPIFAAGFNGAQVYAISILDLVADRAPRMKAFDGLPLAEGPAYTLQPATAAPGVAYNTGTAYFMSALDFFGTVDNRIAVWRLSDTGWLSTGTGSQPALTSVVVQSQSYGQPPDTQQRPGAQPLADAIGAGAFGKPATEHLSLLAGNDDRMQQVMFDGEHLWSSLSTVVKPTNGPTRIGVAYFIVKPSTTATGALSAGIVSQGYVSVNRNSVLFPSVAVNKNGRGVLAFTLVGPDHFPSAAYALVTASGGAGAVQVAKAGAAPEDGFTGYVIFGGRTSRWGDYSAAAVDEAGNVWFAVEYIPNLPRTLLANWGTFIGKITP